MRDAVLHILAGFSSFREIKCEYYLKASEYSKNNAQIQFSVLEFLYLNCFCSFPGPFRNISIDIDVGDGIAKILSCLQKFEFFHFKVSYEVKHL